MDAKMPKLPAYVFRRSNGSYRYKRNVPKKLRQLIGKDTLYPPTGSGDAEVICRQDYVILYMQASW